MTFPIPPNWWNIFDNFSFGVPDIPTLPIPAPMQSSVPAWLYTPQPPDFHATIRDVKTWGSALTGGGSNWDSDRSLESVPRIVRAATAPLDILMPLFHGLDKISKMLPKNDLSTAIDYGVGQFQTEVKDRNTISTRIPTMPGRSSGEEVNPNGKGYQGYYHSPSRSNPNIKKTFST